MASSATTRKVAASHLRDKAPFSFEVPDCVAECSYEYRGVVMPNGMPPRCMKALENFQLRPDDTFIITYPKSGTTWMQQIMLLIKFDGDASRLEGQHVMKLIPFLDAVDLSNHSDVHSAPAVADYARDMPSPRMLKTHSLPDWLPLGIRTDDPEVKVIYVVRNPKDTAVSYYHFCRYALDLPTYESWDIFFEEFLAGRAPQGSWFENVLPWWRRRNHPNVLFLKYEDMKKDLHETVKQVARFMGKSLSDDLVNRIVEGSTFGAMKKSKSSNPDSIIQLSENAKKEGTSFMRKGVIGDWKNYFSDEQNRRFDELYSKEMAGSGLDFQFE